MASSVNRAYRVNLSPQLFKQLCEAHPEYATGKNVPIIISGTNADESGCYTYAYVGVMDDCGRRKFLAAKRDVGAPISGEVNPLVGLLVLEQHNNQYDSEHIATKSTVRRSGLTRKMWNDFWKERGYKTYYKKEVLF